MVLTLKIPFQSRTGSLSMDQQLLVDSCWEWPWNDLVWDAPGPRNDEFIPQLVFIPEKLRSINSVFSPWKSSGMTLGVSPSCSASDFVYGKGKKGKNNLEINQIMGLKHQEEPVIPWDDPGT